MRKKLSRKSEQTVHVQSNDAEPAKTARGRNAAVLVDATKEGTVDGEEVVVVGAECDEREE